jgi:hypothetical protein
VTERLSLQAAADDPDVTVYIARDGAEIGECRRGDVAELVREGELLPSDHYWYEGMENWLRLEELLESQVAKRAELQATQRIPIAPPPEKIERTEVPPEIEPAAVPQARLESLLASARQALQFTPQLRRGLIIAGIICGGFVVAAFIAILVIRLGHDPTPVRPKVAAAASAATPILDTEKLRELRDKAAGELRAKIERLPAKPEPPLYTFYYDVAVDMRRALTPRVQWEALVRGSENAVAPNSEQTIRRTEFALVTEYRDGQWTFKHYKASIRNLVEPGESEEEHDGRTPTPPALVTMLGLRIEPPEPDGR